MRTLHDLVGDILSLSKIDTYMLAEALALYDIRKAEQFQHMLGVSVREEEERRLNDWNAIGSRLLAKAVEEEKERIAA